MKRIVSFVLLLCMMGLGTVPAEAEGLLAEETVNIQAPSALLMEKETGTVIYAKNAHRRLFPASVTKIMTMLLIVEELEAGRISLDERVTASQRAASFGGSCVYLEPGEEMSVEEMLKCIAVVSANDCAVAMAEHISGSEELFVAKMEQRAQELGMKESSFTNCTGLFDDGEHYTTAYDVAIMSRELLKHEMIKDYTTIWMDDIRNGEFQLSNTNKLVSSYPGCTGLKTGYTSTAMYCLSASAQRDGVEYIAVVMSCQSSESRERDAAALLDVAFANFSLCPLTAPQPLPSIPVELGKSRRVALRYEGPAWELVPGKVQAPEFSLELPEKAAAPLKAGERLGSLTVSLDGKELRRVPICCAENVERAGFWGLLGRCWASMLGL